MRNSKTAAGCMIVFILLTSPSQGVKMAHIEKWESTGNVNKLIKTIKDKDPAMRIAAINSLGKLKAEKAVKPLGSTLSDEIPKTTEAAVKALTSIGTDSAHAQLLKALDLKSENVLVLAADALGNSKYPPATDPLIRLLADTRDAVVIAAAWALGKIADPKAIPALAEQIKYAPYKVKLTCVNSLRNIGGEEAAKAVVPTFGHLNTQIRQVAIDTFVDLGKPALPYAYEALQNRDSITRTSGLAIIQGLDQIPKEGEETVWYLLTETTAINRKSVDRDLVLRLAALQGDTVPALIQALQFGEPVFRATAFRTLEIKGEACTAPLVEAATAHAKPVALKWFKERNQWRGAPSWRIDLWAAATALNPHFSYEHKWRTMLREKGPRAQEAMKSANFKATREYVPLLINQMTSLESESGVTINFFGIIHELKSQIPKDQEENLKLAMAKLVGVGQKAVFPLIASLNDNDPQVADASAEVLGRIYDPRAIAPLLEQLAQKAAAGEQLAATPFYTSLQKLGHKETGGVMAKVRPNKAYAKLLFQQTYPGTEVKHTQSGTRPGDSPASPAAFKIHYLKNGQKKALIVQFHRTKNGDWIPRPPLPEALP